MLNMKKIEQASKKFADDLAALIYAEAALAVSDAFGSLANVKVHGVVAPAVAAQRSTGTRAINTKRATVRAVKTTLHIDARTTLGAVTTAGRTGAKLAEIAKAVHGQSESGKNEVKKELQRLKDSGVVVVRGNTRGARWYLKTQAPKS